MSLETQCYIVIAGGILTALAGITVLLIHFLCGWS